MLKNYIKITFRNLIKYKFYSLTNILGLAVGFGCFLLISLYINNELSYDNFHNDPDRIFRVLRVADDESTIREIGVTSAPYAEALKNDFPLAIESVTRLNPSDGLVEYKDKSFIEKKIYFADDNFFEFFNFPLISGDANTVLKEANNLLLSKEMAVKYFGNSNPVGEIITIDKNFTFQVTGIFDNTNLNSHLEFDFLGSIKLFQQFRGYTDWWNNSLYTYVKLKNPLLEKELESQFAGFMEKYFGDYFEETGRPIGLTLEPLEDIYFNNETSFDFVLHGDKQNVYIFSVIAFFVLFIACINFVNLTTARSSRRAKEVGLRKVIGAERKSLIFQFLGEALLFSLISLLIAVILIELLLPSFNSFIGKDLSINFSDFYIPLFLLTMVILVGLVSGAYPSFFLSALQPVKILKGNFFSSSKKNYLKQGLVVLQFSLSVLMIVGTIVIIKQMNFISNKKLGFDKDQVLILNIDNAEFRRNRETFKNNLLNKSGIMSVSMMSGEPGGFHDNFAYKVAEKDGEFFRMRSLFTDHDYLKTFGIDVVEGRGFSKDFSTDNSGAIVLNETAVRNLGWTNNEAIGKSILINFIDSTYRKVIGVVKDFHFTSLKNNIEPLAIAMHRDHRRIAVKISGGNIQEKIAAVEKTYAQVVPGYPFAFNFLDENFDALYKAEQKEQTLFTIFSFLAIFIASMGLLGLVMYATELRKKEIGVRKVLGASVPGVVSLLSKEFIKLILISNFIAFPVAYYFMNRWLEDFAYKIELGFDAFLITSLLTLLIAMLTTGFQVLRAALSNPIDSIRYE